MDAERTAWDWSTPLDEQFVAGAAVHEPAAELRVARARRVAAAHRTAQPWRAGTRRPPWRGGLARRMLPVLLVIAGLLTALVALGPSVRPAALPSFVPTVDGSPRVPRPPDASDTRLLAEVVPPVGEGGYALLDVSVDGFDPCRPVHWTMNLAGAPPDAAELLGRGFAQLSAATGLAFVHDGVTDETYDDDRPLVDRGRYGDRYSPVLVTWADAVTEPQLAGGTGGFAGPRAADPDLEGARWVSGSVVLDAPDFAAMPPEARDALVLHELGHVVGLGHVDDPHDTMHATTATPGGYTAGARRGLAALGAGGCG